MAYRIVGFYASEGIEEPIAHREGIASAEDVADRAIRGEYYGGVGVPATKAWVEDSNGEIVYEVYRGLED